MHPLLPLFRLVAPALALALVSCAGLDDGAISAGPAVTAEAPQYRVGDRWIYRGVDRREAFTSWLDLTVSRTWHLGALRARLYLEVLNVLNQRPEPMPPRARDDGPPRAHVPLMPVLGLEAAL